MEVVPYLSNVSYNVTPILLPSFSFQRAKSWSDPRSIFPSWHIILKVHNTTQFTQEKQTNKLMRPKGTYIQLVYI